MGNAVDVRLLKERNGNSINSNVWNFPFVYVYAFHQKRNGNKDREYQGLFWM